MQFKAKPPSSDNTFCCVYGCHSKAKRSRNLSFHQFPKPGILKVPRVNKLGMTENIDGREAWMLSLKMGNQPSNSMKVCSLHFTAADYLPSNRVVLKHRLKRTAIPSQNLPTGIVSSEKVNNRVCSTKTLEIAHTGQYQTTPKIEKETHTELIKNDGNSCTHSEETVVSESLLPLRGKTVSDIGIQERTARQCVQTDDHLNSLSNLCTFQLLEGIESMVKMVYADIIRDS